MGTRGLTMVVSNQETKVAQYGQFDHYPSGQGAIILNLLKKIDIEKFKSKVNQLSFYQNDEELQTAYETSDLPELDREWGGQIIEGIYYDKFTKTSYLGTTTIIERVVTKLIDERNFAYDSLFCEWAYVIDLDKNIFEVYKGFNQLPLNENERFYKSEEEMRQLFSHRTDLEYYPVRLLHTFDLNNLPNEDEFITILEPQEEEEEL